MSVILFAVAQAAGSCCSPAAARLIKKMKAAFQLRQGPRLSQPYSDLAKLLRKGALRSTTASWVFVAGPRVYFASTVVATTLVPAVLASAPLEGAGASCCWWASSPWAASRWPRPPSTRAARSGGWGRAAR